MRISGKLTAAIAIAGTMFLAACSSGNNSAKSVNTTANSASSSTNNSSAAATNDGGKGKTVALLLPENTVTRWEQQDRPFFEQAMKKYAPNATVRVYNALGDPATQLSQAKTALTAGANVLVVVPTDTSAAAAIVTEAHQQNVPVISYSRLIKGDVDYFIGKDSVEVGREQGQWLADNTKDGDNIVILNGSTDDSNAHLFNQGSMSVLQPLFDAKKRNLVGDLWIDKYDPAKAQAGMEQLLTKNHNNIQGVLAANDGIAGGVVAALRGVGMDGKLTAITGLDATLAGVQRILQNTQGMSILQPIPAFGDGAAQLTAMLFRGETPPTSFFSITTDNGVKKVPTHAVKTVPIMKDNVMETVTIGLYTKPDLCKGIAAGTGPC